MPSIAHLLEIFWALAHPFLFMWESLIRLPPTIFALLRAGDFATLLSPSRLQSAWFGRFWAWAGPNVRNNAEVRVVPLLEGRVKNGVPGTEPAVPPFSGVVLEVGAGSGMWVDVLARVGGIGAVSEGQAEGLKRRRAQGDDGSARVTKMYGVEPNAGSHAELRRRVGEAGLDGIYEVVPVGIEEIGNPSKWDGRIEEGSLDCIVSILCLCSIPEPEKNIASLYRYLKKGGRWYVYEHVRARRNLFISVYQWLINLVWPHMIGGCELCRDTADYLKAAGPWETIELNQPPLEPWYHALPHVYGTLIK